MVLRFTTSPCARVCINDDHYCGFLSGKPAFLVARVVPRPMKIRASGQIRHPRIELNQSFEISAAGEVFTFSHCESSGLRSVELALVKCGTRAGRLTHNPRYGNSHGRADEPERHCTNCDC